jgi:hypothetical protein
MTTEGPVRSLSPHADRALAPLSVPGTPLSPLEDA